jgi:hypothetical protein
LEEGLWKSLSADPEAIEDQMQIDGNPMIHTTGVLIAEVEKTEDLRKTRTVREITNSARFAIVRLISR